VAEEKKSIALPEVKSVKDLGFKHQKFCMIGAAGIGKSEFFAQDPNVLFIDLEGNIKHLEGIYKVEARSWDDLRNIYNLLFHKSQEGNFPYSNIVFDTIDRVCDFAAEEVIENARNFYKNATNPINTIGDVPEGNGWAKWSQSVMGLMNKMQCLPCAITFIGHLKTKTVKEEGRTYDKHTISIAGNLGIQLLAWANHIMYVESYMLGDQLRRRVRTRPSQSIEAKSHGGTIPDNWVWGNSPKENFDYFRKLFV